MSDQADITWMDVLTKLLPVAGLVVAGFWAVLAFTMGGYKSTVDQLSVSVSSLEQRVDGRFGEMAGRFNDMDNRFTNVDTNVAKTETNLEDEMRTLKQQNQTIIAQLQGLTVEFGDLRAKIDPTSYDPSSQPLVPNQVPETPRRLNLLDIPVANAEPGYGDGTGSSYRKSGSYGSSTSYGIVSGKVYGDFLEDFDLEQLERSPDYAELYSEGYIYPGLVGEFGSSSLPDPEVMEEIASSLPKGLSIMVIVHFDPIFSATADLSSDEEWQGWAYGFGESEIQPIEMVQADDGGMLQFVPGANGPRAPRMVTCSSYPGGNPAIVSAIENICTSASNSEQFRFMVNG